MISWIGLALVATQVEAATITKKSGTQAYNNAAGWIGGVVPGPSDIAEWNVNTGGQASGALGASMTWLGMRLADTANNQSIGNTAGATLTLGAAGIECASNATRTLTVDCRLALGTNQTWTVAGGALVVSRALDTAGYYLTVTGHRNVTLSAPISGSGGLIINTTGSGIVTISGANTYSGTTTLSSGLVRVNGSLSASSVVSVGSGATLGGTGTIGGPTTIQDGGVLAPGTSAGTLTFASDLNLRDAAVLSFELLGSDTTVGSGVNDLVVVGGTLTLDGVLNVTELTPGSFLLAGGGDKWRLFNYSGALVNNGLLLGSMPTLGNDLHFELDVATPGQVNLMVVPEVSTTVSFLVGGVGLVAGGACRRRKWRFFRPGVSA